MNAATGFYDDFVHALLESPSAQRESHAAHTGLFSTQPGFSVYRNTVMKGWIDALLGNYPAVQRLVGEEWLRAAGAEFVLRSPPNDPRLLLYGAQFPAFLETFAPAQSLPYLSGVAQLDRAWTLAHVAPDEPTLSARAIEALGGADLDGVVLKPRASAHWCQHAMQPIYSLWHANRDADIGATIDLSHIAIHGEGAILVRPDQRVESHAADSAAIAFLDACRDGMSVAHAASAALSVSPRCDLQQLIATLFHIDAFSAIRDL